MRTNHPALERGSTWTRAPSKVWDIPGQTSVQRSQFEIPTSNGHGAVVLTLNDDLDPQRGRRITHFREHLFATEEPALDGAGQEIWTGQGFAAIHTRDLLFDAYFGLRVGGMQTWLTAVPVDLDASGYLSWNGREAGGTGIATMVQRLGDLEVTQYVFAPRDLPHAGFVMAIRVHNTGTLATPVQAFSLHNFHLGHGRPASPWNLGDDIDNNDETMSHGVGAYPTFTERGFAGTVVAQALGFVNHFGTSPGTDIYSLVDGGTPLDLPDNLPSTEPENDAVSAWQFDLGSIPAGESRWAGVAFAHHADPEGAAQALLWLETFLDGRGAQQVVDDEIAAWADFQDDLVLPAGLSNEEEILVRHSATMLAMGQVREERAFLREWLDRDGMRRRTRLPVTLPGWVEHDGKGSILASLPPGNWTYAWIRDGAYATSAMAALGMETEARASLEFYLAAEAGRFQSWAELADYDMPPYQISLVRYHGFGIEETDFNEAGPNLEFDGFGLFLWALRNYEKSSGDHRLAEEHWEVISARIADVIVALVEPSTGLLRPDSSIWETHWQGRQRHFTYTNITAVRGLCDAAEIAARIGDGVRARRYRETALALREAIAMFLTDEDGALAGNMEELAVGTGYWDAAVWDAMAMGLFDPTGDIATATAAGLDAALGVSAGSRGWARNDDRTDHPTSEDLSPWGSEYDSAEWVITDLRGAMAARAGGDVARADGLLAWILDQSLANYLMVAETYDEVTGDYKFNAPMLGFGAGAFTLAVSHRAGVFADPACGEYYDEGGSQETDTGDESGDDSDGGSSEDSGHDSAHSSGDDAGGESDGDRGGTDPPHGTDSESSSDADSTSEGSAPDSDSSDSAPPAWGETPEGCACSFGRRSTGGAWLWGLILLVVPRRPEPAQAVARGGRRA